MNTNTQNLEASTTTIGNVLNDLELGAQQPHLIESHYNKPTRNQSFSKYPGQKQSENPQTFNLPIEQVNVREMPRSRRRSRSRRQVQRPTFEQEYTRVFPDTPSNFMKKQVKQTHNSQSKLPANKYTPMRNPLRSKMSPYRTEQMTVTGYQNTPSRPQQVNMQNTQNPQTGQHHSAQKRLPMFSRQKESAFTKVEPLQNFPSLKQQTFSPQVQRVQQQTPFSSQQDKYSVPQRKRFSSSAYKRKGLANPPVVNQSINQSHIPLVQDNNISMSVTNANNMSISMQQTTDKNQKLKLLQLEKFRNTFQQSFQGSRFIDDYSTLDQPSTILNESDFAKIILDEELNIQKFNLQIENDRKQIDNDINLLKHELTNIFEDLKVKLYQDLDKRHKMYFTNYMTFKEKFQEYEVQLSALQKQETPPLFPLMQENKNRVNSSELKGLMKLEEEYKIKLQNMNQQIAQSLLDELQTTANDLLKKTTQTVYNGSIAIKVYQNFKEGIVKTLRSEDENLQKVVSYPEEHKPKEHLNKENVLYRTDQVKMLKKDVPTTIKPQPEFIEVQNLQPQQPTRHVHHQHQHQLQNQQQQQYHVSQFRNQIPTINISPSQQLEQQPVKQQLQQNPYVYTLNQNQQNHGHQHIHQNNQNQLPQHMVQQNHFNHLYLHDRQSHQPQQMNQNLQNHVPQHSNTNYQQPHNLHFHEKPTQQPVQPVQYEQQEQTLSTINTKNSDDLLNVLREINNKAETLLYPQQKSNHSHQHQVKQSPQNMLGFVHIGEIQQNS